MCLRARLRLLLLKRLRDLAVEIIMNYLIIDFVILKWIKSVYIYMYNCYIIFSIKFFYFIFLHTHTHMYSLLVYFK